jgi:hypothetical protein
MGGREGEKMKSKVGQLHHTLAVPVVPVLYLESLYSTCLYGMMI